jgi:hypothetical protein
MKPGLKSVKSPMVVDPVGKKRAICREYPAQSYCLGWAAPMSEEHFLNAERILKASKLNKTQDR